MDGLNDLNVLKLLLWVVPGAMITMFRSFSMRGTFPAIGKDDVAAFILGSVIFDFVVVFYFTGFSLTEKIQIQLSPGQWLLALIVMPAIVGVALGFLEASDAIGHSLRKLGIRLPSPDAIAWETAFREIGNGAVLLVSLKDGAQVFGRWVGGRGGSAASTDPKTMDLYLGEIGIINDQGQYVPKSPRRGAYISAPEIRWIEVIGVS
jgi:hypothetical protein